MPAYNFHDRYVWQGAARVKAQAAATPTQQHQQSQHQQNQQNQQQQQQLPGHGHGIPQGCAVVRTLHAPDMCTAPPLEGDCAQGKLLGVDDWVVVGGADSSTYRHVFQRCACAREHLVTYRHAFVSGCRAES